MSRINDNGIGTCRHQCLQTRHGVSSHAHASSHAQPAFLVFASHGFVLGLGNVLVSDESHQLVVGVHHRQLLYFMFLQDLCSRSQVGPGMRGHQILMGHHLVDGLVQPAFKTQVTVGHDANQMPVVINNRNTSDVIAAHHFQRIPHGLAATDGHRVVNHAVLGTLHDSHLVRLFLNRHVLVYHADASLACDSDGHGRLGDGIHGGRHERSIHLDVTREFGFQPNLLGQNFRISGN